jgi:hypothetical protein
MSDRSERGQLATALIEAGVGVLLILAVISGFVWTPTATVGSDAVLDQHASDTVTLLLSAPPIEEGQSSLNDACLTTSTVTRDRAEIMRQLQKVAPTGVGVSLHISQAHLGERPPTLVETGTATRVISECVIHLEMWWI